MKVKRALWLINNPYIREYEVSTLIENGYEVFTPKIVRLDCGSNNSSVTWKYDKTLSIEQEKIDILNKTDFYGRISEEVKDIINAEFEIAFLQYYPEQLRMLVNTFSGGIVLRASGRSDRYTYTEQITDDLGYGFHSKLKKIMNRFWFTEMYPGIAKREGDYLKRTAQFLPTGLAGELENTWVGGSKNIMVNCPEINLSTEQHDTYQSLKSILKKTPHLFIGVQPIPVNNDPNITGTSNSAQLVHSAGLFEPAQDSFELPYTALDAMRQGVPVIYMNNGPMGHIGGNWGHAGSCATLKEALEKIKRLQKHDKRFISCLLKDQRKMMDAFAVKDTNARWTHFLKAAEEKIQEAKRQPKRPFRIGIILPNSYTRGVLDYSSRLMKCIKLGAAEAGDQVEVFFGYTDHPVFEGKNYFKPFQDANVPVSSFSWAAKDQAWLKRAVSLDGCQMKSYPDNCWVLNNCSANYEEADYLIITADRAPGYVFCRCPMAVLAHDYIQRYVPEVVTPEYENILYQFQRQADAVFVTSEPNYTDALQCGGNQVNRTYLTPLMYDLVECPDAEADGENGHFTGAKKGVRGKKEQEYFLWSTNPARHKNHIRALRALNEYYARGGKLKCYMTGANTSWLNLKNKAPDDAYITETRQEIEKNTALKGNLIVCGELPKAQYTRMLGKAKFVFHPGYADNGNGTVIDAACLGVPSISSDYPAMRYINDKVGIQMHFFDPFDSEAIAAALIEAERNAEIYAKALPTIDELRKHTVEGTYRELYGIVKEVTGI